MKYVSNSELQTKKYAEKFAKTLKGGEILSLIGDLGAGKTAFTKGLAKGLGVKNIITSPTFVLMKVYQSEKKRSEISRLAHLDAYRLDDSQALKDIGIEEYFEDDKCVTVIEWADRVEDILPETVITINFKILKGDKREINII